MNGKHVLGKESLRRILSAMLALIIVLLCAACGEEATKKKKKKIVVIKKNPDTTQVEDSTDSNTEGVIDDSNYDYGDLLDEPEDDTNENELRLPRKLVLGDEIPDASGPITTTLYVKDFGAVGDGKTDDGKAIFNALMALWEVGKDAKLVFEPNKTYYYKDNGTAGAFTVVFSLDECVNVHIEGNNTHIITEAPNRYIRTNYTTGCSITGFTFEYGKRSYLMAQNATEIDTSALTCVMEIGEGMAESYLGLTEIGQKVTVTTNGAVSLPFGIIESAAGRMHMFLYQYELVAKDKIKIYFIKGANEHTAFWMKNLSTMRLILPTPGVGHMVEHAFHFWCDRDFTFKDIKLYDSARFAIGVSCQEGVMTFDNVDIVPNPALKGTFEEVDFTSWRDGWHCKENAAQIIWKNCEATGLQDDIFNVSCSVMWLKEVQAANRINMYWNETGGTFNRLVPGERITIINTQTGEIVAETKISRIVKKSGSENIVTLTDSYANMPSGEHICVLFEDQVAPNSIIDNCHFVGTNRFRGPITVTNTTFIQQRMWIDIIHGLEGPVPKDMLFKNCIFKFEDSKSKFVHLSAYNSNVGENSYHVKNIVFEDCVINENNFEIGFGDEVIFKNCRTEE